MDNSSWHDQIFGECALALEVGSRNAEHFPVFTEVGLAAQAEFAVAAVHGRIECDRLTLLEVGYFRAESSHGTRGFMPHDDRRNATAGRPVVAVNVAAANTASLDLDQNVGRTGARHWDIDYVEMVVLREQKRFHAAMVSNRTVLCDRARGFDTVPESMTYRVSAAFLAAVALMSSLPASAESLPTPFAKRLVAFYGSWSKYQTPPYSAEQIPYKKLTHIIHAGINLNEPADGSFTIPKTGFLEPALLTKAHAAGVKVLFFVGAYNGNDYSILVANPSYRAKFIRELKTTVARYGYDGIDIDWEYQESNADQANFTTFAKEIRAAFPSPSFLISTDVPNYPLYIDFAALKKYVSFFNIMLYDEAGPWTGDVQMNSPVYSDPANPNPQGSVDQAATDFTKTYGIPPEQLNMGTPFYGYDYMNQKELYQNCQPCNDNNVPSLNYGTQIKPWINKQGWIRKWNWVQDVPYLVRANGGPGFITYDDSISTYKRVYYSVWTRGLGGSFMWELSADYDGRSQELLEGMYAATLGIGRNTNVP